MRPICWLRKSGGRGQRDDLSGDHVALHGLRQRGHWQGVQEVGQTFQYSVRQSHSSFDCLLLPGHSFSFEVYFDMPQVWAGCRNCWTVRKQHRLVVESCQQLFYISILVWILWATILYFNLGLKIVSNYMVSILAHLINLSLEVRTCFCRTSLCNSENEPTTTTTTTTTTTSPPLGESCVNVVAE